MVIELEYGEELIYKLDNKILVQYMGEMYFIKVFSPSRNEYVDRMGFHKLPTEEEFINFKT